jgi:hypothetical protein
MIFNTTCEKLYSQEPKTFMENLLIHINVSNNVKRTSKKYKKITCLTQKPSSLKL